MNLKSLFLRTAAAATLWAGATGCKDNAPGPVTNNYYYPTKTDTVVVNGNDHYLGKNNSVILYTQYPATYVPYRNPIYPANPLDSFRIISDQAGETATYVAFETLADTTGDESYQFVGYAESTAYYPDYDTPYELGFQLQPYNRTSPAKTKAGKAAVVTLFGLEGFEIGEKARLIETPTGASLRQFWTGAGQRNRFGSTSGSELGLFRQRFKKLPS